MDKKRAFSGGLNGVIFLIVLSVLNVPVCLPKERALRPQSINSTKIALVIGNSNYGILDSLQNPLNDALAMKRSLEGIGFFVQLRLDGTRDEIISDIKRFGDRISGKGKLGFFFYAGHGVQISGENFIVPVEATIDADSRPDLELVSLSTLLREMARAKNLANIVVLDACRDNPYRKLDEKNPIGLAEFKHPSGKELLLAYATGPGQLASDGIGPNSVFTGSLQRRLRIPGIKIEDVFKGVVKDVMTQTNNQQQPWITFSLTRDICLVSCPDESSQPILPPTQTPLPPSPKTPKVIPPALPPNESPKSKLPSQHIPGVQSSNGNRFRLFLGYGMASLIISKESPTRKTRFGTPEKDTESYSSGGIGFSLQYFLDYDFSLIYHGLSAELHGISLNTDSGKSTEIDGNGSIEFRSILISYNWGGERNSWIGEWWVIYLGFGYGHCSADLEAYSGERYDVSITGGQTIFGFDYRSDGDWVIGSSLIWNQDGSPNGNRVRELEDRGYRTRAVANLATLSVGYQFD